MSVGEQVELRNPYLDAFNLYVRRTSDAGWWEWEWRDDNWVSARHHLTHWCAWAVPTDAAIYAIADLHMPVVEIGAGNGYWAWMLEQTGVTVDAFDTAVTEQDNGWCECDHWTRVQTGGTEQAAGRPDHALLLCWPPYDTPMAEHALAAYDGDTLIYIGEGPHGCNATEAFFTTVEQDWDELRDVALPQWPGMHDHMTIYRRRPGATA